MKPAKNHTTIFTIGHSTHTATHFLEMLKSFSIAHLVDVRHFPGSKKFPQYNRENLKSFLEENHIKYTWLENLGGRRKLAKEVSETKWKHPAFKGYAAYMQTDAFKIGIQELVTIAENERTVYMCSEAVWWRCHRSLISDLLKFKGWKVEHIMNTKKITEHPYTEPAGVLNNKLNYTKEALPLRL